MDDFGVRGSGGGGAGCCPDFAVAQAHKISYSVDYLAHSPALSLRHTFRRFPAYGYVPIRNSYIYILILSSSLVISRVLVGAILVEFWFWLMLDIYWKNEHRLMCTGEVCTASERDRYEKAVFNSILF